MEQFPNDNRVHEGTSIALLDALKQRIVLCDGAMGTQLLYEAVKPGTCLDELNLERPELVKEIHQSYVLAGAEVIETNTFGANRLKLARFGLEEKVREINKAGVGIAREAAPSGAKVYVAGSVGPLGRSLRPIGSLSEDHAKELFAEQVVALSEAGVDLILIETIPELAQALVAAAAALELTKLPVGVQLTYFPDGRTASGTSPEMALKELSRLGVHIIGTNCGAGPRDCLKALTAMARARSSLEGPAPFLSVQPNAGFPQVVEGRVVYLSSPAYFAEFARRSALSGADLIGGCCGTGPEHIKAMRSALSALPAKNRLVCAPPEEDAVEQRRETGSPLNAGKVSHRARLSAEAISPGRADSPPVPTSPLSHRLKARFTITVEMDPPKGDDVEKLLRHARTLSQAGVDAINVADNPMARVRMSPISLAHLLQERSGVESILHFTCRDRNLIGMQSDLIGAGALGIRNVLALTGDPPGIGDHPQATAVFDVNSEGLVRILSALNNGTDLAGNPVGRSMCFCIGVAANPGAGDLDAETAKLRQKLVAGAHFVQTQPVFEAGVLKRFLERMPDPKVPVLAGILPLRSHRHAEFLHNEVPGIQIPEELRERMRKAGNKGQAEGVVIAMELLAEIQSSVAGVCLMPPFEHYEVALAIMDGFKDRPAAGQEVGYSST